jgi:hypothetical protein
MPDSHSPVFHPNYVPPPVATRVMHVIVITINPWCKHRCNYNAPKMSLPVAPLCPYAPCLYNASPFLSMHYPIPAHIFHALPHPHPYTIPPCGSNAPRSWCTTCPLDLNCSSYTSLHHTRYFPARLKIDEVTRLNVDLSPTVDHDHRSTFQHWRAVRAHCRGPWATYSAQCGLSAPLWSENKKLFFTETKTCSIIPTHTHT